MKSLVKVRLVAVAAMFALVSMAYGQLPVNVKPGELPTGAFIDVVEGDHYYAQSIEVTLDGAAVAANLVIQLPAGITLADLDGLGAAAANEVYYFTDQAAAGIGVFTQAYNDVTNVLTVTFGGASAAVAGDIVVIFFPVETDATPAADLQYTVTFSATASQGIQTVDLVTTPKALSFDGTNVKDLGDGPVNPNRRGKFHPNAVAPGTAFLAAAALNLIDESPTGVVQNFAFQKAANDWLPTTAGIGDVEAIPDGDPDNDTETLREIEYYLWASTEKNLRRMERGAGAIPVGDYDTATDIEIREGVTMIVRADLRDFMPEGYWYFYVTSSATTDWALASSDTVQVIHAPTPIVLATDLVSSGAMANGGLGSGVDYDKNLTFDPGVADDVTDLTLDGGGVIGKDGTMGTTAYDNMDVFWFVEDINDNARIHIFRDDENDLTHTDAVITGGVVTGLDDGVEVTAGQTIYEEDLTNYVNYSVTSPSVEPADDWFLYLVMYDGENATVELIRDAAHAAMNLHIVHHPYLAFHNVITTDDVTWDTHTDQYYPISWGENYDGDKDPDADPGATIILYAVDESKWVWTGGTDDTPTGTPDAYPYNIIGTGSVIVPKNNLATNVNDGIYLLATIVDDADDREDNRYMWDIRNSGAVEGTYSIWGTIEDGSDLLTVQLNTLPGDFSPATPEDLSIVLEHRQHFLANNPFAGEGVELTQDDVYEFTWEEAAQGNTSVGKVKMLLVPVTTPTVAADYIAVTAAGVAPDATNIGQPIYTPAAAVTELNDLSITNASAYTGTDAATFRIVLLTASTFDWYRDGVKANEAAVTIGAGPNFTYALPDGITLNFVTGGAAYTAGGSWIFYAFPQAANTAGNYWVAPGSTGPTHVANNVGYTASQNKATLAVSSLTDDYGTAATTPAAAATAGGYKYYDVYYYYAADGIFDGLEAISFTNSVEVVELELDDMTVTGTYSGLEPHTYKFVVDAEGAPDTYEWFKDGVSVAAGVNMVVAAVYIGDGIYVTFAAQTLHGLNDEWSFRVEGHQPVKADGQVYFNGSGGAGLNYRVVSSSVAAQQGDTLDLTLQATYNSAGAGQDVALLQVYLDLPTDNLSIVGETDTVFAAVPACGFQPFVNGYTTAGGYQLLKFEAYLTGGKQWGGGGDYADNEWVDVATFQVEVTGSYSGAGMSHNIILFNESTAMADDNLDPLSVLVLDNAVDVQLYRRGSIAGSVEIEGRTEETEQVNVFVAKSGSYDPIDDASFLLSNGNDADATDGIQVSLEAGGAFTLYDVPTGQYDVYVTKPGWLTQKQDGITVQPTASSSVNFQNADKLLGGDVAGYLETDGKDYPDNQIYTEDETVLVGLLGTSPAAVPESYADLTGDAFVGIEDLTIVVKNVGAVTKKGEGLLYKELEIRGTNENALVALIAPDMESTEATFVIQARDLVSLRGFAAELVINSGHWELASFESGLSSFGNARSYQRLEGDYITFYSASAEWDGLFEEEMALAFITLISKVADPEAPSLKAVTLVDHNFIGIDAVIDDTGGIPTEFSLSQNFPNPFNPVTTVNFALPDAGKVRLAVYNLLGQEVRSLISGNMDAGSYKAVWNSMDNTGRKVSSGVYFYRLMVDGKIINTRKMLLLK